jgi:hypothetical protein
MHVLLVNPPIYDFTAYDFWLRPYGMLRVAGRVAHACTFAYFNYLFSEPRDPWGRGRFHAEKAARPSELADLRRHFRRFGRPRSEFREFLRKRQFDAVLIQTGMTYWYPGVAEVLEDVRELQYAAKTVLGGVYATICPQHARALNPDLVIEGSHLDPLWRILGAPRPALPHHEPEMGSVAVMKLTDGCPFLCTYCSVPLIYEGFRARPAEDCLEEARRLARSGVRKIALYDDALLFKPEQALLPFLEGIIRERLPVSFHTPNALHPRFLSPQIAQLMVRAGFRSFYLGFESTSAAWLAKTGAKSSPEDFAAAVQSLRQAGAEFIGCYLIIGHPDGEEQEVEASMEYAHRQGARIILSEFSPVPGTADGERCRPWANLEEPLSHNKTAFTIRKLGAARVNELKTLCRQLNEKRSQEPGVRSQEKNPF